MRLRRFLSIYYAQMATHFIFLCLIEGLFYIFEVNRYLMIYLLVIGILLELIYLGAGISSKGILNFLDLIEENQIELHSFMVIRHGQCAAKGWWKPYDEKFRHPLNSFSKSLTATAIGFAEQEGILSLDEKIVDIFPDLLPENPSENLKKITLHHLLIMGCGHETEIMDNSENWISTFLHHPVLHEPGTFYKYNTAGTNMLAAVLRKKTGQNVTEFLKSRLLEPLGITSLTCALLGDGTELGGGGMKMVTEDMAKFTYFLSRQGEWEGKQLLQFGIKTGKCTAFIGVVHRLIHGVADGHFALVLQVGQVAVCSGAVSGGCCRAFGRAFRDACSCTAAGAAGRKAEGKHARHSKRNQLFHNISSLIYTSAEQVLRTIPAVLHICTARQPCALVHRRG